MYFLFTLRIQARIDQYVVMADNYDGALEVLKYQPKLEPFKDYWGNKVWIVSCYLCETEPKEV